MAKEGKKGFIAEFKEFITRGNVVDMAVGVIVGSAFTTIVNSLVNDIFNPIIGYFIGGVDFTDLKVILPTVVPSGKPAEILYGQFIQNVVTFLLTALVVFMLVKGINKLRRKKEEEVVEEEPAPAEPEISPELQMLTEIRDLLAKGGNIE